MFMRRKKGFSLVEMLVVIAIIAVLVSIIIPTVGASQTKANAAANAANLRSVKGQLAVLMVDGQFTHDDATSPTVLLSSIAERAEAADKAGYPILAGTFRFIYGLVDSASKWLPDQIGEAVNRMNNTYYAQDGKITIAGVDYAAPSSKAVSVDGLTLRKDTEMTVTFAENSIIVTYDGITSDVFAAIAESGDASTVNMSNTAHGYVDANGDGLCDYCNNEHGIIDEIVGGLDGAIGGGHTCTDSDSNCVCDDVNCGLSVHDFEADFLWGDPHKCKKCDQKTACNSSKVTADGHFCSVCDKTMVSHSGSGCSVAGCPYHPVECGCSNYEATRPDAGWWTDDSCKNCDGHDAHSGGSCTKIVWRAG